MCFECRYLGEEVSSECMFPSGGVAARGRLDLVVFPQPGLC